MIETPTVLILGAGASKPYGFPSGRELLHEICSRLSGEFWEEDWGRGFMERFERHSISVQEVTGFRDQLYYSGKSSVDAFLETNPTFMQIGKMAIAETLVPLEDSDALIDRSRDGHGWYEYLVNKLDSPLEMFGHNRLAILTYNYDRSLEEFLHISLMNTYNCSPREATNALDGIPIVHLHGVLGLHPSQGGDPLATRDYSSHAYIPRAADGIKIIHEVETSDAQFRTAYHLLAQADRICFLGFGYNPINLGRLKLPSASLHTYWGSAFGMGQAEIETAKGLLPGLSSRILLGPSNLDCLGFLREVFALR